MRSYQDAYIDLLMSASASLVLVDRDHVGLCGSREEEARAKDGGGELHASVNCSTPKEKIDCSGGCSCGLRRWDRAEALLCGRRAYEQASSGRHKYANYCCRPNTGLLPRALNTVGTVYRSRWSSPDRSYPSRLLASRRAAQMSHDDTQRTIFVSSAPQDGTPLKLYLEARFSSQSGSSVIVAQSPGRPS